ncbi:methyltransferase domain-containing protein, partial [bacterium]|nr:methyltransferase domain-containing protein [bacterium]
MTKIKYKKPKEEIITDLTRKKGYIRDLGVATSISVERTRREFGAHLTSVDIFKKFIFPEIKDILHKYVWVDLFCGEGNLILPILEVIPKREREIFFKEHIFLFDIQKEMVEKSIRNAQKYGISVELARKNIRTRDTLADYPKFIKNLKYPVYHITNPPYLYLGY